MAGKAQTFSQLRLWHKISTWPPEVLFYGHNVGEPLADLDEVPLSADRDLQLTKRQILSMNPHGLVQAFGDELRMSYGAAPVSAIPQMEFVDGEGIPCQPFYYC
jgi:hypothetical protein